MGCTGSIPPLDGSVSRSTPPKVSQSPVRQRFTMLPNGVRPLWASFGRSPRAESYSIGTDFGWVDGSAESNNRAYHRP